MSCDTFHGSFGTQNLMVILIFNFDPRKGQLQVKLGQIRSNLKIQKFSYQNMPVLCRFVSGFQICHLSLCTIRNAQNCISKLCCHHLYLLFCHGTAKNKGIALKFCMRIVCMYLDHINSVFWIISDFIGNYF